MTREQSYAAFQKKKKQSAKRKEELEAGAVREQKLQDELKAANAKIESQCQQLILLRWMKSVMTK